MTPEKHDLIEAVHRVWLELQETRRNIRAQRAIVSDVLDQNDEFRELTELTKSFNAERKHLKAMIAGDRDVQKAQGELDELQFKLKDLREIMSHHLVNYYDASHDRSIADPEGEYRQIIIAAKMGKPTIVMPGQTSLLDSANVTITMEDSNGKSSTI